MWGKRAQSGTAGEQVFLADFQKQNRVFESCALPQFKKPSTVVGRVKVESLGVALKLHVSRDIIRAIVDPKCFTAILCFLVAVQWWFLGLHKGQSIDLNSFPLSDHA